MNATRGMPGIGWVLAGFAAAGICASALGHQGPAAKPNELVAGKLVYVAPMPDGLDLWIIDALRHWGKYKLTSNPEGVDLVIQSTDPEHTLRLENRAGTAQPRGADRPPNPIHKGKHEELPAASISMIDWVSNQPVWQADIMNRNPKKDEAKLPAGPQTKIFARSLTPDQIAQKVITELREYEESLEKSTGGKN